MDDVVFRPWMPLLGTAVLSLVTASFGFQSDIPDQHSSHRDRLLLSEVTSSIGMLRSNSLGTKSTIIQKIFAAKDTVVIHHGRAIDVDVVQARGGITCRSFRACPRPPKNEKGGSQ